MSRPQPPEAAATFRNSEADFRMVSRYLLWRRRLPIRSSRSRVLMSGLQRSTVDLDPRRKKMLFRSWHRGMREMDLIMGRYAEVSLDKMSDVELDTFEALIEVEDRDLLAWITGMEDVPAQFDTEIYRALKAFHKHDKPIHS
jgi:antitoxin CptB